MQIAGDIKLSSSSHLADKIWIKSHFYLNKENKEKVYLNQKINKHHALEFHSVFKPDGFFCKINFDKLQNGNSKQA